MMEQTLVLIKPDGVQRGLVGRILGRFEDVGLKIKGVKMVWVTPEFSKKHYKELLKKARTGLPQNLKEAKRLEIPELKSAVVGNRTKLLNLVEVAKIVRRDLNHIIKFLSKEVASQATIEAEGVFFNGKIGNMLLNNKFKKYLKKFLFF